MRATILLATSAIAAALIGPAASAQDSYSVTPLAEAPPDDVAPALAEAVDAEGIRVLDADGAPVLDVWLRKSLPIRGEVTGPASSVLFPFLEVGQLFGVVRIAEDTGDYKAQTVLPGVYTMRYALQPVDGDHLGISKYRDYLLLSFAEEDTELAPISQDDLQSLSTGPSGTNHPAVFLLLPAEQDAEAPGIVRDDQAKRTSLVLRLPLDAEGNDDATLATQLVIEGAGPH